MGKASICSGGLAVTLFCTYAAAATALEDTVSSPWYLIVLLIASAIASTIFLVTGIIYLYQYRELRKKAKLMASHKALVEAFKRAGMTDEGAEIAATGEPAGPHVDGLDDDGWITIRR